MRRKVKMVLGLLVLLGWGILNVEAKNVDPRALSSIESINASHICDQHQEVLSLLNTRLIEQITGGTDIGDIYGDRTVNAVLDQIADIYGDGMVNGTYAGITGQLQASIIDFTQVDHNGNELALGSDAYRQLIFDLRRLIVASGSCEVELGNFIVNGDLAVGGNIYTEGSLSASAVAAEYLSAGSVSSNHVVGDRVSALDMDVRENLTISGTTTAGLITATVVNGSIIKSVGVAELGGLQVAGSASIGGLLTADDVQVNDDLRVKDHIFAGSGHFNNHLVTRDLYVSGTSNVQSLRASRINSSGIIEGAGLKANEALITGDLNAQLVAAERVRANELGASEAVITRLGAKMLNVKNGLALGEFASVHDSKNSAAIGSYSNIVAPNSIAIGPKNTIVTQNSVALGKGMLADNENSLVMGMDFEAIHIAGLDPEIADDTEVARLLELKNRIQAGIAHMTNYLSNPVYTGYETAIRNYIAYYQTYRDSIVKDLADRVEAIGGSIKPKVGIGTSEPEQTLHISGAMKLEPMDKPPSNPSLGVMYMNSTNALCVYMKEGWELVAGDGVCPTFIDARLPRVDDPGSTGRSKGSRFTSTRR